MIFYLSFRLAAVLQAFMATYMPTNRAVAWLRSPRGLKWAIPVSLVATPAYLFATSVCRVIIDDGGPEYLYVLVLLFAWNAMKFLVLGCLTPILLLARCIRPFSADRKL